MSEAYEKHRMHIESLGGLGDGVGYVNGQAVYVSYTCPGDEVEAVSTQSGKVSLEKIIHPSAQRQTPPCKHFTLCGGCSLQHLSPDLYRDFKIRLAQNAVQGAGYDTANVSALYEVGPQSRRRAEFKISVQKGVVRVGFYAPQSHQVVAVAECKVVTPRIMSVLIKIETLIASLKKPADYQEVHITDLAVGLDILFLVDASNAADKTKLLDFARQQTLRLTLKTKQDLQVLYESGAVKTNFGGMEVELPPGAFLQASADAETYMRHIILQHLDGCKSIVDLYCGAGTYTLPLAATGARLQAYEGDNEMIAALYNAARRHGIEGRVTTAVRDLYRAPVTARELERNDGAVINPPRNGAEPQTKELAKSGIKKIVMVSCNPATFTRDAKHLQTAGYMLKEARPVDQFYWTPHLELVACFIKN